MMLLRPLQLATVPQWFPRRVDSYFPPSQEEVWRSQGRELQREVSGCASHVLIKFASLHLSLSTRPFGRAPQHIRGAETPGVAQLSAGILPAPAPFSVSESLLGKSEHLEMFCRRRYACPSSWKLAIPSGSFLMM